MSQLAAVVFDFDGIIMDSETPEFESHRRVFERYGASLPTADWSDQIGIWNDAQDERWFRELCRRCSNAPDAGTFLAEKRRIFDEVAPREPMRGVRELVRELAAAGIPAAIASSSSTAWVGSAIGRIGMDRQFAVVVTGDDVARRKPAPDLYLEAARRLGVEPARAVAIEDSAPGIAAARAAGLATVAIPHWLTEGHDVSGADLRVAHAGELTLGRLAALVHGRGRSSDRSTPDGLNRPLHDEASKQR
jgi:HAD superfamily hydrolase (TIGR01509 family)